MKMDVEHIVSAVEGTLLVGDAACGRMVEGVTWDSREVTPGCLYVALMGERVDGHDFALAAVQAGAAAVLAMHALEASDLQKIDAAGAAVIEVPDTISALSALAGTWRSEYFKGTVIGLTGSTGKTTTKNLVRDVLESDFQVSATKANQNNELGVPRTLLDASADDAFVVVEMGMRGMGQIEDLCSFVKPDWGIITNVGESHIELLGSRDNIMRAKAELFCALPEGGVAFVNEADDYAVEVCEHAKLRERDVKPVLFEGGGERRNEDRLCISGGRTPRVWATDVALDGQGRPSFLVHALDFPGCEDTDAVAPCTLQLAGVHNVSNACSAIAVGIEAGMTLSSCVAAVESAQPEKGRQQLVRMKCGALLVNDAYNANPDSMKASLATFAAMKVPGRHIAVLGEMGELGSFADECHDRVGACAGAYGFEKLVFVGEHASKMADAARRAGAQAGQITCLEGTDGLFELLESEVLPDDAVLLKASHFMGFEKIAEGLVG